MADITRPKTHADPRRTPGPTLLWARVLALDRKLTPAHDLPPKGAAIRSLPSSMPPTSNQDPNERAADENPSQRRRL